MSAGLEPVLVRPALYQETDAIVPPHPPFSLLILAGGAGLRLGGDKLWRDLGGNPLIRHGLGRLIPYASEVIFSAPDDDRLHRLADSLPIPARIAADQYSGGGPLAGLHAGLAAANFHSVFALAADMPFANPLLALDLLRRLDACDAAVPLTTGPSGTEPEPLHAAYRRICSKAAAAALQAGRRRAVSFLPAVRTEFVPPESWFVLDPTSLSFFNVNTPQDWKRACSLIGQP